LGKAESGRGIIWREVCEGEARAAGSEDVGPVGWIVGRGGGAPIFQSVVVFLAYCETISRGRSASPGV
jgi:hypothetical protein